MPVRFRYTGSIDSGIGNLGVTWPLDGAGVVQLPRRDDLVLLVVESANQAVTAPAGWTASYTPTGVGTAGAAGATRLSVFHRRITENTSGSAAPLATVTVTDPGDHAVGQILLLTGIPTSSAISPIESVSTVRVTSTTGSFRIPGVTSSYQRNDLLFIASRDNDSAAATFTGLIRSSSANLQNITKISDVGTTSGNGGGFAIWEVFNAAPSGSPSGDLIVSSSVNIVSEAVCISFVPDTDTLFYDKATNPLVPADTATYTNGIVPLTPPHGMTEGQLVVMSLTTNSNLSTVTASVLDTGGQTWTTINNNNRTEGTVTHFWATFNGTWSSTPSLSGSGAGTTGLVAAMLVFDTSSAANYTWNFESIVTGSATGQFLTIPSGSKTTINPNTVTLAVWSDNTRRHSTDLSPLTSSWSIIGMGPSNNINRTTAEACQSWAYNIQTDAGINLPAVAKVADVNPSVIWSLLTFYQTSGVTAVPRFVYWNATNDDY